MVGFCGRVLSSDFVVGFYGQVLWSGFMKLVLFLTRAGCDWEICFESSRADIAGIITYGVFVIGSGFCRQIGSDIKAAQKVLSRGMKLESSQIGLLTMIGVNYVSCYTKPLVGVMSTGNEVRGRIAVNNLEMVDEMEEKVVVWR